MFAHPPLSLEFGTDGIRGRCGVFPVTSPAFRRIAFSYASIMSRMHPSSTPIVLVGRDTRASSLSLSEAVMSGLVLAGVDVWDVGVASTPIISSIVHKNDILGGIVVSASHNQYHDNGLKFFSGAGLKVSSNVEVEIINLFYKVDEYQSSSGRIYYRPELLNEYLSSCYNYFSRYYSPLPFKIAIDCSHGALYRIAPSLFRSLGFDVLPLCCQPNGYNINNLCGSTSPDFLVDVVKSGSADIGLCFDGDGDRVLIVMPDGSVCDGSTILYLFSKRWLIDTPLSGVVGTVMTNSALEDFFKMEGIPFYRSLVGDKNIVQKMATENASLGGEPSGHLIVNRDGWFCSDAMFNIIELLFAFPILDDVYSAFLDFSPYPQRLLNLRVKKHYNWEKDFTLQSFLSSCRVTEGDSFRVLIRLSGTEPVLRIMLESRSEEFVSEAALHVSHIVNHAQGFIDAVV